ncbi:hypothetical protein ADK55_17800 [Streptomyces sp. WM4235]|uniref:hypothetical protein n=1 Tax=Streptomyces sp. WM4235 TaxID=1415551 RepID=UPI0006AF3474|nr:hypothetical protein [Streptomyces sp. WM4235]KOU52109.1 hypothetical protein ADK55_17800 [Streptomyces sp. WM4235]
MSQSVPPSPQPDPTVRPDTAAQAAPTVSTDRSQIPGNAAETAPRDRKVLARVVPRSRGARWAVLGTAVVLVGGAAAVTGVAVSEHHRDHRPVGILGPWAHDGDGDEHAFAGPGERRAGDRQTGRERGVPPLPGGNEDSGGRVTAPRAAPAPLPSLAAKDAVEKAAGAVSGGSVESLRVVGQQGGGSAWLAVVVGPDGVRHAVTLSGADGTITGNTVTGDTVTPGR